MKPQKIAYIATTSLVAFAFASGGALDLTHAPAVLEPMTKLGYPLYVASILGAWKLLGAAAIVAPRLPRVKEWAYAGMVFELTGAAISHAASGDPAGNVVTPLVLLALVVASWALRPESRTLKANAESAGSARFGRSALAT